MTVRKTTNDEMVMFPIYPIQYKDYQNENLINYA